MLYPYPTSLNQEAVMQLLKAFTGDLTVETAHAAWEVGGFALSQIDPHPPIYADDGLPPMGLVVAEAVLLGLVPSADPATKIDWARVWQAILLILELFRKKP